MNKQTILAVLLMSFGCLGAHAQVTGATKICDEQCTITSTTGANVSYIFGSVVDTKLQNVPAPVTYPLIVDCTDPTNCGKLGGDPDVRRGKSIFAVQQAVSYTVTVAGVPITVPAAVPLLPAAVACLPVTMPNAVAVPRNCILAPNAVAIATDGALVAILGNTQSVYLQYCQGENCDPPFIWNWVPLIVGPNASMGGPTGGTGVGTLYAFPGQNAATILSSAGPAVTQTIPGGAQ